MGRASAKKSPGKQVYTNNVFSRGMYWTNGYVNEGTAKAIVNFDIASTGDSAKTRKAFKGHNTLGDNIIQLKSSQDINHIYLIDLVSKKWSKRPYGELDTTLIWKDFDKSFLGANRPTYATEISIKYTQDGDTVVDTDDVSYRLIGVDTPELSNDEPYAETAKKYLNIRTSTNQTRYIEYDDYEDVQDTFTRRLVYLWCGNSLVNAELIKLGLGRCIAKPHHKYYRVMKEAEEHARKNGLGLFSTLQTFPHKDYPNTTTLVEYEGKPYKKVKFYGHQYVILDFQATYHPEGRLKVPIELENDSQIIIDRYDLDWGYEGETELNTEQGLTTVINSDYQWVDYYPTYRVGYGSWEDAIYYITMPVGMEYSVHLNPSGDSVVPPTSNVIGNELFQFTKPEELVKVEYLDGLATFGLVSTPEGKLIYNGDMTVQIYRDTVSVRFPTPYTPKINEAINVGFNLRQDKPFEFRDYLGTEAESYGYYGHSVLGVLALDEANNILTQSASGMFIRYRAYLAAPDGLDERYYSGYAIKWEYKSNHDEDWIVARDWEVVILPDGTLNEDVIADELHPFSITSDEIKPTGGEIIIRVSFGPFKDVSEPNIDLINSDKILINTTNTERYEEHKALALAFKQDSNVLIYEQNTTFNFGKYSNRHIAIYGLRKDGNAYQTVFLYPEANKKFELYKYEDSIYIDTNVEPVEFLRIVVTMGEGSSTQVTNYWTSTVDGVQRKVSTPWDMTRTLDFGDIIAVADMYPGSAFISFSSFDIWHDAPEQRHSVAPWEIQFGVLPTFKINAYTARMVNSIKHHLDLSKAEKLSYFMRQLILYGGDMGDNIMQFTAFEQLNYAPYPYSNITIPEKIIHIHPHNDKLIIFGLENIYMLHGGLEPLNMILSKIYSNLTITEEERNTVVSIGSEVFFLSNNKGWMIQPNRYNEKDSEVYIYSVTDAIEGLLSNPRQYIYTRLNTHYEVSIPEDNFNLTNELRCYPYNKKLYIFSSYQVVGTGHKIMLTFIYDTEKRRWYMYDMVNGTHPHNIEIIENGLGMQLTSDKIYLFESGLEDEGSVPIKTMLMSGNMNIDAHNLKRAQELYLTMNNIANLKMDVKLEFFVDGKERQTSRKISATSESGHVYESNAVIDGNTVLGEWELDLSSFPISEWDNVKVNFGVSGIGRSLSFIFATDSKGLFELLNYGIIYKKKGV